MGVKEVGFYVDGERVATLSSSSGSFNWDSTTAYDGSHWLYITAYDASGNHGSSQIITLNVNNGGTITPTPTTSPDTTPPTTSITSPTNGSNVNGVVNVTASASDNIGVTKVELYKNGVLFGTDTSSPYTFSWDTTCLLYTSDAADE